HVAQQEEVRAANKTRHLKASSGLWRGGWDSSARLLGTPAGGAEILSAPYGQPFKKNLPRWAGLTLWANNRIGTPVPLDEAPAHATPVAVLGGEYGRWLSWCIPNRR